VSAVNLPIRVGREAIEMKGWWRSFRWLVVRRGVQLGLLAVFLAGPWFGWWVVKGNLASSRTLDTLPLTDPYVALQSLAAGHWPFTTALIGAAIVLAFYLLVGGRVYCSWVCPVNLVTDAAEWTRRRLNITNTVSLNRQLRFGVLAVTLIVSALTATIAWEFLNPVSTVYRGLLFGMGLGWAVIAALFLFDLLVARRGWCGHLCPVGAFYSLIGRLSLVRVSAARRAHCNDCMDCYAVCPEPQVIPPALKGTGGHGPLIDSAQCTNCARCLDVCSRDVFRFSTRFHNKLEAQL
jgi:ferredoxin-type protein NapH